MAKYVYISIFFICFSIIKAQVNLVPNPSFELLNTSCFHAMGVGASTYVSNWYNAKESPDYFNICANTFGFYPFYSTIPYSCRGYIIPHNGNAYTGLSLFDWFTSDSVFVSAENLGIRIIEPLKANRCYYAEMYISLAEISNTQINSIGMLLTQNNFSLSPGTFYNYIQPQIQWDSTQFISDTLNWVKINGTLMAQGGEEYLTIGNFKDGNHIKKKVLSNILTNPCDTIVRNEKFCYVYIDDVALYELPQNSNSIKHYTLCAESDSLMLGDSAYPGMGYKWFSNGNLISHESRIKVKPNVTSTYVLQATSCGTGTHTFVVTHNNICPPSDTALLIPNTFTPNNDGVNDVFRFTLSHVKDNMNFTVYNRWGNIQRSITSEEVKPNIYSQLILQWDGRTTSGEACSEGVYFYTLSYTDANGEPQSLKGYVSLFR